MTICRDFPIAQHLWYRIGGTVRYLFEVENKADILQALELISQEHIEKVFVVGTGANLVFPDGYFDGAVIHLIPSSPPQIFLQGETQLEAYGGEILDTVISFAFAHNLKGLEWAGGLPGTVGAAVRGNVGAFGGEIKDHFESAEVLVPRENTYELRQLEKTDMEFSYRNSFVKRHPGSIVISARLRLPEADADHLAQAKKIYQANIEYRRTHHPHEYPNTGSVFKNITESENITKVFAVWPDVKDLSETKWYGKISVGYLNKRLGFSGFQIGQARVSEKHANFIDNLGGAKATDVVGVIAAIKQKYHETFGFMPEAEVEIVT